MRTTYSIALCAFLAFAALSTGCKKERYYCDVSGCFLCDGLGCRPVNPPDRPVCSGDFQCLAGQKCTSAGCVAECTDTASSTDCARGTVCMAGQCVSPAEPTPTPVPGSCTQASDCMASGTVCVNGTCEWSDPTCTGPACGCDASHLCTGDKVCVAGSCVEPSAACQFNSQCGSGKVCIDGTCHPTCTTGPDTCGTGFVCQNGGCYPNPPTGQCTTDVQCGSGKVCVNTTCVIACTSETCGAGYYCKANYCAFDDRPHPACSSDAQCQPGHPCVEGVCRTRCSSETTCQMFSASVPYCHNSLCVTFSEANSNCVTNVDCNGGASADTCVDGLCQ